MTHPVPNRENTDTWELNETVFLNGVTEGQVDDVSLASLRSKSLSGNTKTGSKLRPVLDTPLHTHNDGGSGGISFVYRKEADNTVTPVVFDIALKRNDNIYAWKSGGRGTQTSSANWR